MEVGEAVPQLVQAAPPRAHPEQMGQNLETRVVLPAIHIEDVGAALLSQEALDVIDHQRLARSPAAEDKEMIGDASFEISKIGVNDRLGLLAHQRLFGNMVEIEDAEILDVAAAFVERFGLPIEVVSDFHRGVNGTARINHHAFINPSLRFKF